MAEKPHMFLLGIFMVGMIICGAGNGIATKLSNNTTSLGQKFHHPFFQSFTMFIGESM
jgi:hypothetical protein